MKCPKCGEEIANDSNFCEFCGERITTSVWQYCKSHGKTLFVIFALLFIIGFGLFALNSTDEASPQEASAGLTYEENVAWEFPIGNATYSGYVLHDPDKGKVPHTIGVAKITDGEYKGSIYDGEFNMGKMEGRAKYTLSNGDVFVGEFKDNQYDKGKYIIASSGEFFEGTFKNGEPDEGNWYNKSGDKI
jgi:hypothetical protein